MIRVTKFDGKEVVLNGDWIQSIEATPDTLITLTNGVQLLVKDSVTTVVEAYKIYRREIFVPDNLARKAS